jgi:broad specificity phosphatase PhoE
MDDAYIVVVVAMGDGEADYGLRVSSIRCRTQQTALAIAKTLNTFEGIKDAFVIGDLK